MPDHVHMLLSIPPKYAVSHVVGYIKGKSAIYLAKTYGERQRNFTGYSFGSSGYRVGDFGGSKRWEHAGEDLEAEIFFVFQSVSASLKHADLVVEALDGTATCSFA